MTASARSSGLRQEFITPLSPEQNGMVERPIRTTKEQCVHRHRFETLQHASRVIGADTKTDILHHLLTALRIKLAAVIPFRNMGIKYLTLAGTQHMTQGCFICLFNSGDMRLASHDINHNRLASPRFAPGADEPLRVIPKELKSVHVTR